MVVSPPGRYIRRAVRLHDPGEGVEGRGALHYHEEHEQGVAPVRAAPGHEVGRPRRGHRRRLDRKHEHRDGRQQGD